MKIGTRSVLFGAHQFLLHPLFVAVAWHRLYGFPWDPRLWVAFFVHDLGYWGKPNMDGPEGEEHPRLGARIMGWLFDRGCHCALCRFEEEEAHVWHDFTLYHSRFMARRNGARFSRLCVADKLAMAIMPAWLYLTLVNLTGEITEYMAIAQHRDGGKYSNEARVLGTQAEWFESMCDYMLRWIEEHRDGRADTWTPALKKGEA